MGKDLKISEMTRKYVTDAAEKAGKELSEQLRISGVDDGLMTIRVFKATSIKPHIDLEVVLEKTTSAKLLRFGEDAWLEE